MNKENLNESDGQTKVTTDHDEIKMWIEERGGTPSMVESTMDEEGEGLLRIDFGEKEESLEPVMWEDFFRVFENRNLAFLYQNKTSDGSVSRFFKFINREDYEQEDDDDEEDDDEEDEEEE